MVSYPSHKSFELGWYFEGSVLNGQYIAEQGLNSVVDFLVFPTFAESKYFEDNAPKEFLSDVVELIMDDVSNDSSQKGE